MYRRKHEGWRKRFMSINLFFLHSYAYEISRKDLFVLLLYGCVSPFYIHVACQERVQYIESINRVTLYSICLCRYIIQVKASNFIAFICCPTIRFTFIVTK